MNRFVVTSIMLALCSLMLMGCPVEDGDVKVIDDIGLEVERIGQNMVNFFNDLGDKVVIQVDDIIASAQDGGFLRKVVGVNQSGGVITAVTEAISLAEAIKEGVLSGQISWTNTDFENSGVPMAAGGTLTIDLSGITIFSKDGVTLSLTEGSTVTYAPSIALHASFYDHKLETFSLDSNGLLSTNLNFKLAAYQAATLNYETTIIPPITKPFVFYIGAVPVAGVASLTFPFGVVGTVGAGTSLESGFSALTELNVGASYLDDQWTNNTTYAPFSPVANPLVVTLSSSGSLSVYMKVQPSISLYESSTLTGWAQPYITADAQFIPSPLTFDLYAGLNGGINYNLKIFDFTLVNKTWNFPGPQWQLYQYTYPYDIPTTFTFNLP